LGITGCQDSRAPIGNPIYYLDVGLPVLIAAGGNKRETVSLLIWYMI